MLEEQGGGYSPTEELPAGLDTTVRVDIRSLVHALRQFSGDAPHRVPVLRIGARTDMGRVRDNNEDKFDYYEPDGAAALAVRGSIYAVGDGVGGAQAGQVASEVMLKTLFAAYYDSDADGPAAALEDAIVRANDLVHSLSQTLPDRSGMGTTLTAAVFIQDHVLVAQVGDSRAYLARGGQIRQVTADHSLVEEQVRAGLISREDAANSQLKNIITRSIGGAPQVVPDFFEEECRPGDVWVLCSDGLTSHVDDDELLEVVSDHGPCEAARVLVEAANARGGSDNITVVVVRIEALAEYTAQSSSADGLPAHQSVVNGTERRSPLRRLFGR